MADPTPPPLIDPKKVAEQLAAMLKKQLPDVVGDDDDE